MAPGAAHLLQGVVGGIAKGASGSGPGLEGEHLLLLLIQQRLHILDQDPVPDAMGLQEDFDSLEASERHSDIGGRARLGRAPPEVQLGRTRATLSQWAGKGPAHRVLMPTSGWAHRVLMPEFPPELGMDHGY